LILTHRGLCGTELASRRGNWSGWERQVSGVHRSGNVNEETDMKKWMDNWMGTWAKVVVAIIVSAIIYAVVTISEVLCFESWGPW
jgi:hypothetical protein